MQPEGIAARCQWLGENGRADAGRILGFLESIEIAVIAEEVGDSLLSGMTVRHGQIVIDPAIPAWPGDLLHDAGHIAMCEPATRYSLEQVSTDPAEEMGAIAWSVAAASQIGIPLEAVFHQAGYKGASETYIASFRSAPSIGVPFLAWLGMTAEPRMAEAWGIPAFPVMQRWLR